MNTGFKIMIVVITIAVVLSSLIIPSLALTYTNTNHAVCVKFTVPECWIQQDLKDDRDILKVRYTYFGDTGEVILFGFCDLRSIGTDINDIKEGSRKEDPNSFISPRDQIAEIGGVDADTIEIVNYYGIDYYKCVTTTPASTSWRSNTGITKLFCVIDGIMYTFQYGSTKNDFSHFTDFEEILNNVVYTIPSDSKVLEICKLNQSNKNIGSFFNLVITIMLYLLPIFILRYSINKNKCLH